MLTRGQLIDRVWGADYVGDTKTLDVHVKRLRAKIEPDPANPISLTTVRGLGYKFDGVSGVSDPGWPRPRWLPRPPSGRGTDRPAPSA